MIGSVILLVVLIFLNAVFASAEIAVISMNDTKLKRMVAEGDKRAVKLASLTEQPAKFLATIQVAITLSGLLSSAFAADYFAEPLVGALLAAGVPIPASILKSIAVILITLILAYFNLVLGELVPKRIAMKKADTLALGMAGMLFGVGKVFAPLVGLLTVSTNLILRMIGINPNEDEDKLTEEEIRMMLAEGNEQGVIDEQENEIIQNVFEFGDLSAEQICSHRMDVTALDEEEEMEEWESTIHETRHTYYPIYKETKDNITGILDTKDYFRMENRERNSVLEKAVKPVYFIPEDMKADILFENMRRERKYFAVLLDEYGGMSGIITIHDLLEALVGDLYEIDSDEVAEKIQKTSDNKWTIYGEAELSDVAKELKINLPTELYDTFNGFIYSIIGKVPEDGEQFECEGYNLKIKVHTVCRHRIKDTSVELIG